MRDTIAQTRFEYVSKLSNDSLLTRVNTFQCDEDRLKLYELIKLCTNLQSRVIDLEKTKTTKAIEIDSLKRRVKKLERRNKSRTHKLKRLYKVGLTARVESSDEESLDLDGEEVFVEHEVAADKEKFDEVTLARALSVLKTSKPKVKGVVIQDPKPVKHKKKDQIRLDEEDALKLQAEFDEEQRLAREKAQKELEANIALIET
nr:hypothetical protein [Tanacetum cinerariifolium]